MFWLPAAIWALFVIMVGIFGRNLQAEQVSMAYTGVVLPLIGGILGAYAVLDDPALELHFTSPRSSLRMIGERFGMTLLILTICAAAYQVFAGAIGLDLSGYGSLWQRQIAWIVPCLAMTSLGYLGAFASAQSTTGAMMVGMVWIIQVIAREWFLNTNIAREFFLFAGALYPKVPSVVSSQINLLVTSVIFMAAAWQLFKKQERFI